MPYSSDRQHAPSYAPSSPKVPPIHIEDEYEETFCSDADEESSPDLRTLAPHSRRSFGASTPSPSHLNHNLLFADGYDRAGSASPCSTASGTPLPSRSPSPQPVYLQSSSSEDDEDSDPDSPYLLSSLSRRSPSTWRERPRWWDMRGARTRRRRRETISWFRSAKRMLRWFVRHPFVPKTPLTIILTLLLLTAFGVSLTFLLIYILNPDKEPLPWRGYCTIPSLSTSPPLPSLPPTASFPHFPSQNFTPPSFPPDDLDSLSPAGVFVGVFSIDTGIERRMLVRSTWASHVRSREGAGEGDGGIGTSRTVVRFILGQPRKDWERRIKLEMETYNDMVILPVAENMNGGKSHAYFTWAASGAWVPPIYFDNLTSVPHNLSYANTTSPAPPLAKHDPIHARIDRESGSPKPWVRPDFVMKVDDDSFLMLAELEARLRVALHEPQTHDGESPILPPNALLASPSTTNSPSTDLFDVNTTDPLIYWGYLVKNRFMAGELYGLSYSLVDWISKDPQVKGMTRGAEDKQTSKWMRMHPRASEIRWTSERCWIYDHPRAGTVYSHGFLFPSEAKRVQREVLFDLEHLAREDTIATAQGTTTTITPFGPYGRAPATWARSTVSTFGMRYSLPMLDLTTAQSIEALVEGSEMSRLREGTSSPHQVDHAWQHREGRIKRYLGKRLGGTIAVHFIKKNMWYLETAQALLEGEDITEVERKTAEVETARVPILLGSSRTSGSVDAPEIINDDSKFEPDS
ncbi:hypothetical protein K474DRAFT_1307155 [Panus rudis PR-1116 ss-1]|nr:hypothetical protein K474DRAFT_1307155 [Panus rudis PR-1116 ss-1]